MSSRLQTETRGADRDLSREEGGDAQRQRFAAEGAPLPNARSADVAIDVAPVGRDLARRSSAAESLEYLIELSSEMKQLANVAGFKRLGLVLMLAEQEARQQLRKTLDRQPR